MSENKKKAKDGRNSLGEAAGQVVSSHQDAGEKSVSLTVKATDWSARKMMQLLRAMLLQKPKGNLPLKKLVKQGGDLEQISMESADWKKVRKALHRQGVHFAAFRDKSTGNIKVAFKGKDTQSIYNAIQSCVKKGLAVRASMKTLLQTAQAKANARNVQNSQQRNPMVQQKTKGRGR